MGATTVAIKKRHFEGGSRLNSWRHLVDSSKADSLEQILRNFVDELSERIQSGAGQIANAAPSAVVVLPTAMPDTSYEVQITLKTDPAAKAAGNAVLNVFVSAQTASQFTVTASPAGNVTAAVDFAWTARSRTRINTKAA